MAAKHFTIQDEYRFSISSIKSANPKHVSVTIKGSFIIQGDIGLTDFVLVCGILLSTYARVRGLPIFYC